jgi:hypothetical protein
MPQDNQKPGQNISGHAFTLKIKEKGCLNETAFSMKKGNINLCYRDDRLCGLFYRGYL